MFQQISLWLEGARLRTLPAALAPVIIGTAAAWHLNAFQWREALLALSVALLLQIGVNFSNDYSDGIRGTDANRIGPPRLTGSGTASPRTVLAAALICFAAAALCGLALVALAGTWWMLGLGAAAIIAAWFYTGGRTPYGYMGIGLSELLVFIFFGLVATLGTTYTQTLTAPWWVWVLASGTGALSVALLMVNNIRDRATDITSGKTTLVVRIGDRASRWIYAALLLCAPVAMIVTTIHPTVNGLSFTIGAATMAAVAYSLIRRMTQAAHRIDYLELLKYTGLLALLNAAIVVWSLI